MVVYSYARVSTVEQAQEDRSSIEDQLRRCLGVSMAAGLPNPVEFIDPGVSGSIPLADRPSGGEMCRLLKSGDIVIAAKLDRIFRSASDALNIVEDFKRKGVKLILADLGSDPVTDSAIAKMFLGIMASVAEFEKSRILERMNDGKAGKAKKGGHIGGDAPYGFRTVGSGRDAALEPVENEQETIRRIMIMVHGGTSVRAICSVLKSLEIMTRAGTPFTATQVQRIIKRNKLPPTPDAN